MAPTFKSMNMYEIHQKYKHFSERNFPFCDEIIDIFPIAGVNYSDRWDFLKSLVYLTSKGYYFTYDDVFGQKAIHDPKTSQPYESFLEGALKCMYPYAYEVEREITLKALIKILSLGYVYVNKRGDKYSFTFSNYPAFIYNCQDN
jgi:hypothetical protein